MLEEKGLFTEEKEILEHTSKVLDANTIDCDLLRSEYNLLSSHYRKLLTMSKKLVTMADKNHKQLRDKNQKLIDAEEQLLKLAVTDALTGLLNRHGISNWLDNEIVRYNRNGTSFTLFLLDIDLFKNVNDQYGHNMGDVVLQRISQIMLNSIREQDTVARWGGEEFLLVFPDTDIDGGYIIAEKIRKKVNNLVIEFNNIVVNVTVSLGGCSYSGDMGLLSNLEMADKALYQSKTEGRNKVNVYEY